MTGTAIGIAITSGWIGLAVSSRVIGSIAAGDADPIEKGAAGAARNVGADDRPEFGPARDYVPLKPAICRS